MSAKYTDEEIDFLVTLQAFTVHCVANQCVSKVKSYCLDLLRATQNLNRLYIGHRVQLAIALDNASQRNETKHILNDQMDVISHLIHVCRSDFGEDEEKKCHIWTGIDLLALLRQCEDRFKKQSHKSTLWIQLLNDASLVSTNAHSYRTPISFDFVQHDTDMDQLLQWIHQGEIRIPGQLNRTFGGVPLFWCTRLSQESQSKYGSIRLIFPFSLVYSCTQHHVFDLGKRKNGTDVWHSVIITKRNNIAGYGNEFSELTLLPPMPIDIAIDLTDEPLVLSDVRITFVNHTQRCVLKASKRFTPYQSCYHTRESSMKSFVHDLRTHGQYRLNELMHLFDTHVYEKLKIIDDTLL